MYEHESLNIGIVGLGLIGGSIGRALLKKTAHRVFGKDLSERTLSAARLVKAVSDELTEAELAELDILIFAVNPRVACARMEEYLPYLKAGCIVTDVGGNKRNVTEAMREAAESYPKLCFIGAHPMAGKEFSGLSHAVANLFEGASVLLVPVKASLSETSRLKELFSEIGFKHCKITSAEAHDRMIAFTSQLCHAISASYCLCPLAPEHEGFSAGSFRDLTRVARLNAPMWSELFCDNADYLTAALGDFIEKLTELKTAVAEKDEQAVEKFLAQANERKEEMDRRN